MKPTSKKPKPTELKHRPTFVDIFAGCGGLSLGLLQAGWNGLFAIEKDVNAFETLQANLLSPDSQYKFSWPKWLPQKPVSVTTVLKKYADNLSSLSGKLDLLVGGPPCQGFSSAGRRDPNDPRNQLVKAYLKFVKIMRPRLVLIENVKGITADFDDEKSPDGKINYAEWLQGELAKEYTVSSKMIDTSGFGVPQKRLRFFVIAVRKDCAGLFPKSLFDSIESGRLAFLRAKGIPTVPVGSRAALSDLEIARNGKQECPGFYGFDEIKYKSPLTSYQKLMHFGLNGHVSDTRLARHRPEIEARFKKIIILCNADGRLNTSLSKETRASFGLKKCALRVLDPDNPSPTITSMPDDLIHYSEPRALTVRENARLQSFPDWFCFKGKYTTGGERRRKEIPRFTQVANAVPPLVAEAFGLTIAHAISRCH